MPRDIQILRWEHANTYKSKLIQEIIEEREKIIRNNEKLELYTLENLNYKKSGLINFNNLNSSKKTNQTSKIELTASNQDLRSKSTVINKKTDSNSNNLNLSSAFNTGLNLNKNSAFYEQECKLIEKIKAKQKLEAHTLIQYEVKQQILRKEQEERLLTEKLEEDSDRRDALMRKKLRALEERKRELLRNQESLEATLEKGDQLTEINNNVNTNENNNMITAGNYDENNENNIEEIEKANAEGETNPNKNEDGNAKSNYDNSKSNLTNTNNKCDKNSNNNIISHKDKSKKQKEMAKRPIINLQGLTKAEALTKIELELVHTISEINRIHEETAFAKQKRLSQTKREALNRQKQEEFKLNCEKAFADERQKALNRKKLLEEREKERLENLEKTRIQKIKENEKLKRIHKKRFEATQNMLEKRLEEEYAKINLKQSMREAMRLQLEKLRSIALKEKVAQHLKKQEEIQKYMDRNQEVEELRVIELQQRMEEIEKNKKAIDKLKEEEIKNRIYELKVKAMKSLQSRGMQEKEDEMKKEDVKNRIEQFFHKSQKKKQRSERNQMFKSERNSLKRSELEHKLRRIENVKETELMLEREKMETNMKRLQEFREQKRILMHKKRIISIEVANQRKCALEKFEDFLNKNKDITPEIIKQLYPDDKDLLEKIQQIQENKELCKSIHRSTSHFCKATLKKISDIKSQNESIKLKRNISFRSSNNFFGGNSKISANNTKGFSATGYSNFNQFYKTSQSKPKLEPLSEKKKNNYFNSEVSSNKQEEAEAGESGLKKLEIRGCDLNNNQENLLLKENKNTELENIGVCKENKNEQSKILIVNYNEISNGPVFHSTKNVLSINNNPLKTQSSNLDGSAPVNYHSNKNLFNTAKKEKQLLNIKTESDWKKPLSETQMPLISIAGSTKNQNINNSDNNNNDNNDNNNNVINYSNTNPNVSNTNNNFTDLNNNNNNKENHFGYNSKVSSSNNNNNKISNNLKTNFYNFNAVFDDKVKKKIIEKDIEKKVESYKIKLNSEMLKVLKEEKQKEVERDAFYKKAHSEVERKRLENLIALERVQSSERIIRINEENDRKLRQFEAKLKLKLKEISFP